MPSPVEITIKTGRLAVGTDQASLVAYDCQVVSGAVTPSPNTSTTKATFCDAARDSVSGVAWTLDIGVLQDWSADATAFCWFCVDNATETVVWELSLDGGGTGTPSAATTMHGTAQVVPFPFGGDAGAPLEATASWPVVDGPFQGPAPVGFPTSTMAASTSTSAPVDTAA